MWQAPTQPLHLVSLLWTGLRCAGCTLSPFSCSPCTAVEQTAQDEAGPRRSDSAGDLHRAAAPGTSPGDQNLAATLEALAKQTQSLHRDTRAPPDSGNMLDPAQLTRWAERWQCRPGRQA